MPNINTIGYAILEAFETPSEAKIISENSKRVIAEGVVQEAEEENRNGRCYMHPDLFREIACPRTLELLAAGQMRGESGHPCDQSIIRQQTIQPDNCNVKYLKFWMDGMKVMTQFQGTNNALGEAFDLDLRDGDKPAFSLRALGTLENKRGRNVVCNMRMITYDNVIFPSHKGAYTTRLVTEATAMSGDKKVPITERFENKNGLLIPITNESVMNYIKSESANISSIMSQIDVFYESMKLINHNTSVQMVTRVGDVFVVNLENHIQNEIQNYCAGL